MENLLEFEDNEPEGLFELGMEELPEYKCIICGMRFDWDVDEDGNVLKIKACECEECYD